jgi:hypothetical protein
MIKVVLLCFVLPIIAYNNISAQSRFVYRSQNYAGLLEGENKAAFQLQTIHGVQMHKWYAAAGTGLDYYMYRTIPLFLTLNRDLVLNNRTFYVSGDIGTNFPWIKESSIINPWSGIVSDDYNAGLYWSGGIGYKAFFKNKSDAILLNLGYSYKQVKEKRVVNNFCQDPPCQVDTERFNYQLNRISLRIGWQF